MRHRPRLEVDVDGGLVRLRADYDPELVARIKNLPARRYIRDRAEWTIPARRAAVVQLWALIEDPGLDARLSDHARRRLRGHRPGRIALEHGELRLSFAYHPRRLALVRRVPERRFDPDTKSWTVPPTRAGAIALLGLLTEGEFRADPGVVERLERLAAPVAGDPGRAHEGEARGPSRRSPSPHWRQVTRGPIFRANPQRQEWVAGVGWCVRVRVDPARRQGDRT